MEFTSEFEKREFLGREALKDIRSLYPNIWKYELKFTEYQFEFYDSYFLLYDEITHSLKKRVFIEIKIRDKEYDEYVLEKKKLSSLKRKMKDLYLEDGEYQLLYINFVPSGCYMWDITNIDPKECKDDFYMPRATAIDRKDKTTKKCKLLSKADAKKFEYTFDENRLMKEYMKNYILPKVEKKIKRNGLSWILFGEGE